MVVFGTRPEAIKLAPVVLALRRSPAFDVQVVVTGQHREMLDQVLEHFGIRPDHDLKLLQPGQTLTDVTVRILTGMGPIIAAERPDLVMVQGDTTTTLAAAMAAAYQQVPVAHVEAGLRTGDRRAPFPEEINRILTSDLAELHLAPTEVSRQNLLTEGIPPGAVVVTGNTVIDALHWTVGHAGDPAPGASPDLPLPPGAGPLLLVTAHRRESWGAPMEALGRALARIARDRPDVRILFPIHANPVVREAILPPLEGLGNVSVVEPLNYATFASVMARATVILTDSGGIQEEGPSLGVPVLVLRDTTERPEAVAAGTVRLVGTDADLVVSTVAELLGDGDAYRRMSQAVNPYGDGRATERVLAAVAHFFGDGPPADEFSYRPSAPVAG